MTENPTAYTVAVPQFADAEIPAGSVDGRNRAFTLSYPPAAAPILTQNGLVLRQGADYTLSGNSIAFETAPAQGDLLQIWYRY